MHGVFAIPFGKPGRIVVSYTGYKPDTIEVKQVSDVQIILAGNGLSE